MTRDDLFIAVVHKIHEKFAEHAILKGGMQMRLLDSPRSTNDIDYVFIPFKSKNEVVHDLCKVLETIAGAVIKKSLHSNSGRIELVVEKISLQIEFNVEIKCKSIPLSTEALANVTNELPRIIRVMSLDVALAHKLAAWNERRLVRDLYDAYYFVSRLGIKPDQETLEGRLMDVHSRLPSLKNINTMSTPAFWGVLRKELLELKEDDIRNQLAPIIAADLLPGLELKIKASLLPLCDNSSIS